MSVQFCGLVVFYPLRGWVQLPVDCWCSKKGRSKVEKEENLQAEVSRLLSCTWCSGYHDLLVDLLPTIIILFQQEAADSIDTSCQLLGELLAPLWVQLTTHEVCVLPA